jgi:hypothetical protein
MKYLKSTFLPLEKHMCHFSHFLLFLRVFNFTGQNTYMYRYFQYGIQYLGRYNKLNIKRKCVLQK